MADAFQGSTQAPDLFGGLPTGSVKPSAPTSPRQAQIHGLALSNPDADNLLAEVEKNIQMSKETLDTMGDTQLRIQAAAKQQASELTAYAEVLKSPEAYTDPELHFGAIKAAQSAVAVDIEQRAKYATEQEAIKRVQDLAARGDSTQARMLLNSLEHGGYNDVIRDMSSKQLILQREIDKLKDETDGDWLGLVTNFVLSAAPLYKSSAEGGYVDIDKSLKGFGDWFWSGRRMVNESAGLWSMPIHDFTNYVSDELIPQIKNRSQFLFFDDKFKQLSTLSQLNRPDPVLSHNAWATLDNLGWIGPAELTKAVKLPSILVRNGARKEAANLLAQAVKDLGEVGADEVLAKTGLTTDDVIDEMLPAAVNPKTVITEPKGTGGKTFGSDGTEFYLDESLMTQEWRDARVVEPETPAPVTTTATEEPRYTNVGGAKAPETPMDKVRMAADTEDQGYRVIPKEGPGTSNYKPWVSSAVAGDPVPAAGVSANVSLAGDVNKAIAESKAVEGALFELQQLGRLTDAELQAATEAAIKRITERFEDIGIHDVNARKTVLSDNSSVTSVEFTVGTFETDEQAAEYAKFIGHEGAEIVTDHSGIKSIRLSEPVTETGFTTKLDVPNTGLLGRILLSAREVGDRLLGNMAQAAGNTRARILKEFTNTTTKFFAAMPNYQKEAVAQVLAAGENAGKWFTRDELDVLYERAYKRQPTKAEYEAYELARKVNDIEYNLRNDEVYKSKFTQGFKTVSFDTGISTVTRENGKVVEDWVSRLEDRVFNIHDQVTYGKKNPLTEAEIARLKESGFVMVNLEKPIKLADGSEVRSFLAKHSDLKIEPLRRDQIGYRAGGHRIYKGKYFAKQAVFGKQPEGEVFAKNPNTYIVGQTRAEVEWWTSKMEQARQMYLAGERDPSVYKNVLPPYMSGDEFLKNMANGTFEKDTPFRVAYDREDLPEYHQSTGWIDMRDLEETSVEGYLRTNGRMYYSGKGEHLKDFQGAMAPTLDPFQAINQSLVNVANITSFSDYKISAAERWMKTFGKYLDKRPSSPMDALTSGHISIGTEEYIRQQAEAQRDIIKRTLGWRTEFDRQKEIYTRRLSEWVAGNDPYSVRDKATAASLTWWNDKNPIRALRGIAFDLKLGLFNIAQFPLQTATMAAAISLNLKAGMEGVNMIMPMLYGYFRKGAGEETLNTLIERGAHTHGGFKSADEFKAFMNSAKTSGFFDVGGSHLLINSYGPNAAAGVLSSDGAFRQAGRFWFYEAERWNRTVAYKMAWSDAVERYGAKAYKSNDFIRYVAGRAEDYSFRMSEQSAAYWQKGLLSIPTQFWAYNARMLEMMLGKEFTGAQKARLVLGQTLLYGTAGIPVAPYVAEKIKEHTGSTPKIGSMMSYLDRGILDNAIYAATGIDTLVSRRVGTGAFWADTLKDMFGASAYGEKSFMDVMGGATYSIGRTGFETIFDLAGYVAAESGGEMPLSSEAFMRLADNISTVSNAHKAYLVHQYGTYVTAKGTTVVSGLESRDAWATALSFAPGELDEVSAIKAFHDNRKEQITEATKIISNYRTRMINEPANREDIVQEINAYTKLLPPDIRMEAIQRAQNYLTPSLMDSLSKQVEQDKIRAQMMETQSGADSNP